MNQRDWTLLCILALLWGCSFLFMAISLESIPVLTTAFARLTLAGLLLGIYVFCQNEKVTIDKVFLQQAAVLGVLRAALPITLILWAQTRIDSGIAGILNSTSALFTLIIAHLFTNSDKITSYKLIGVIFGMLGVALIIGTDAINGLGCNVTAQFAMLGATLSYGFANVYSTRFTTRAPAISASAMLLIGAACILPFAVVIEWPLTRLPSLRSTAALAFLSTFSTACAFVVWFKLVRSAGPANTALVTFLIPPIALVLGVTILGESPDTLDLGGFVLVATGLWLAQHRKLI